MFRSAYQVRPKAAPLMYRNKAGEISMSFFETSTAGPVRSNVKFVDVTLLLSVSVFIDILWFVTFAYDISCLFSFIISFSISELIVSF
jgi:hypothetical protein